MSLSLTEGCYAVLWATVREKALHSDATAEPELPRHPRLSQILEKNWQAEMVGYYTYRALAEREPEAEA